jgi:hypothetical protein
MEKLQLEVPTSWEDITLKDYLELQAELKNYSDNEEAMNAVLLSKLCGLDASLTQRLSVNDYISVTNELTSFMNNVELPLKQFITIDGKEYGFEPNLSKMSYGAFLDITKYDTLTIDKNWAHIMSILYRPVIKKDKNHYSIEPYDGENRSDMFLQITMDIHFGALFFFVNLWMDLLKGILNSTIMTTDLPPQLKQTLLKSGQAIHQSMSSLMEISYNLKK